VRRLALIAVCAAVACGGSSDSGSPGSPPAPASAPTQTTKVQVIRAVGGGKFDPAAIYQRDAPSVVTILSIFGGGGGLFGAGAQVGQGSGFVISRNGEIATNAHVVTDGEGNSIKKAKEVYVEFANRERVSAKVVGFDPNADVALLRIDPGDRDLHALPLADSDKIAVGEPVAAIGSPFGEPQSLSVGVVSGTGRSIDSLTGFSISGVIQTDAAINKGNSGGPLLDSAGRVLGINSQIRSSTGSGSGVGFAVAVDTVKRSLDQLRRDGAVHYSYMGVSSADVYPQLARRFKLGTDHGAWVQKVVSGGPADDAGLQAGSGATRFQAEAYRTGGDVIVAVAGKDVRSADDLGTILQGFKPGQSVEVRVVRDGRQRTVRVKLAERPKNAAG
jgi:S1-C subfamily serine protease